MACVVLTASAQAQVIERHLPETFVPSTTPLLVPPVDELSSDERPMAGTLRTIALVGPNEIELVSATEGVTVAPSLSKVLGANPRRLLAQYLGRPLTRALISRIEADLVKAYRKEGFPFVEISIPEQEISQGILRLEIIEFHLGKLRVSGASTGRQTSIQRDLRLHPGQKIDSSLLTQDLDWLGRYPFWTLSPSFTPGAQLGETDLQVSVERRRPWRIEAGYSNSGASQDSQDRYFLGATIGGLGTAGSILSAQVTGSRDFWRLHDRPPQQSHPAYESVAIQFSAPIAPRQAIDMSVDAVETNQTVQSFVVRLQTIEGALAWRSALSNLIPLPGDIRLGLVAKSQRRVTLFGTETVLQDGFNSYQLEAGWTDAWTDSLGRSSLDVAVHAAASGVDRLSSDSSIQSYSNGQVATAGFVYGKLDFRRFTHLGHSFAVNTQVIAQYAGRALPNTEQMGLGGPGLVRGYYLNVGSFDDAALVRNELHGPSVPWPTISPIKGGLAPFAFIDLGYGHNYGMRSGQRLASVGLGTDVQLSPFAAANLNLAYPLVTAVQTRAGDWRLEASVNFAY